MNLRIINFEQIMKLQFLSSQNIILGNKKTIYKRYRFNETKGNNMKKM